MALAISVVEVDSDFATPEKFTATSPSFTRNLQTSTFIESGDSTHLNSNTGIVATGFIQVQYHNANQWVTGRIYVATLTGATLLTAINA